MGKRIVALLCAFLSVACGLSLIAVGLFTAIGGGRAQEQFLTSVIAFLLGLLLLELGLAVAWVTWLAARGAEQPTVKLPPWWISVIAYVVAVAAGAGLLHVGVWWLFLPFAAIAVTAPLVVVGRLGSPRSGPIPTLRRLLPAFAWGSLVTPLVAITLQLFAAVGAFAAAAIGFSMGGQQNVTVLTQIIRRLQGRTFTDAQTEALIRIVAAQPMVLAVGAFVVVFAGPVTEELGKFGAALLFGRTRGERSVQDSTATIFLIGLSAGLGFAITENIFYTAQAGSAGWPVQIVVRGITPLMHGTASALLALGWAQQRRAPAGWSLLRGVALAIGLHAAWNLFAGIFSVAQIFSGVGGSAGVAAIVLAVLGGLGLIVLAVASWLTLLRLRRTLAVEADGTPDGSAPGDIERTDPSLPLPVFDVAVPAPTAAEGQRRSAEPQLT
jgi:hypothetical protein